ncbi:MAG: right-handed parallel beta-helix repeat-containing protein [Phycisphaerales bacterium]
MSEIDRRLLLGAAGVAGLAALSKFAGAGPIDPPPGPVGPTGLTLDELAARASRSNGVAEPRRPLPDPSSGFNISQPGSYYLTQDAETISGFITASDVTIDLCGFTITAVGRFSVFECNAACKRLVIRNGRIVTQGTQYAVRADDPINLTLEDLLIEGNIAGFASAAVLALNGEAVCRRVTVIGFRGAFTVGSGVFESCRSIDCEGGITVLNPGAALRDCTVSGSNAFSSISLSANASVIGCVVNRVGNSPAISVGDGSLVDSCSVTGGQPGINAAANCSILRSTVHNTRGAGISVGAASRIADCTVNGTSSVDANNPGHGVRAAERLRLERCTIANNRSRGVFSTGFDAAISDCSIIQNDSIGIECVGPAHIERCHFANNQQGGISFDALTRVAHCHLDFNGLFGVRATSPVVGGAFISDCDITRHTTGVSIAAGTGNGVFRCRFAGNLTNISAPAANFQLIASGVPVLNVATNPNVNVVL